MKLPAPPLVVITDRRQAARPLAEILDLAFAAGCRWASLREKDLSEPEQVALAGELHAVARRHGATLTLHGRAQAAAAAGVDGVHLSAGADAAAARALLGRTALVGISIHTLKEAQALDPAVLDYAIAGPAFPTASKPGYGPALGREGVARLAAAAAVPLLAVGGIGPAEAPGVLAAGAAGVAVMGGIMRSADPGAALAPLLAAFAPSRHARA